MPDLSKTPENVNKQIAQDIARARNFEAMLNTEGWKQYVALINYHIQDRTKGLFDPTPEGQGAKHEHNKGVVWGLLFMRDLPQNTVASMKDARTPATDESE